MFPAVGLEEVSPGFDVGDRVEAVRSLALVIARGRRRGGGGSSGVVQCGVMNREFFHVEVLDPRGCCDGFHSCGWADGLTLGGRIKCQWTDVTEGFKLFHCC